MNSSRIRHLILFLGYSILYIPLICIVVYSFNESRFVNTWTGFSLKWYKRLFEDNIILLATLNSFKIASIVATLSVILGTIAATIINRFQFKTKAVFLGMITAPLIMPEVVIGISFLMLFIGMKNLIGWPSGHGVTTVCISHITLTLPYVTMLVSSRMHNFDKSIEEAAMDLGAPPLKIFFVITLPIIMPSIILGWLLAFVLSLDDVVIASFVSGPGATTLPMVIFSSLKFGISPEINALATILILILSVSVIISSILMYKKNTKIKNNKH